MQRRRRSTATGCGSHGRWARSARARVIGADGVGSFVRRAIGAPRGRWRAQVIEVDTPVIAGDRARDLLHFDLGRSRRCAATRGTFPPSSTARRSSAAALYELAGRATRPSRARDRDRSRGAARRRGSVAARDRRCGASFQALFAERGLSLHEPLARPRALLVGEAAGIDPALGEGIAQAILTARRRGRTSRAASIATTSRSRDWPAALRRSRVGLDLLGARAGDAVALRSHAARGGAMDGAVARSRDHRRALFRGRARWSRGGSRARRSTSGAPSCSARATFAARDFSEIGRRRCRRRRCRPCPASCRARSRGCTVARP